MKNVIKGITIFHLLKCFLRVVTFSNSKWNKQFNITKILKGTVLSTPFRYYIHIKCNSTLNRFLRRSDAADTSPNLVYTNQPIHVYM